MTKKMKLTSIFAAVATFFIALILSLCLYVKPVKAASERVFEMQYGAGVQLGTGKDGLRFIAKMDKDYYDQIVTNDTADKVKLYGFIAPVEEFEGITDYEDFIPESNKRVGGVLDEEKIYAGEDGDPYYYANIVITGLAGKYQNRAFAAVVFIENTTSGSAVYTYANLMQNGDSVSDLASEYRTQYQIVNAAFLDASKNYETKLLNTYAWFGTEQYPIIIATAEQLAAFESKISANAEFAALVSNKYVFIKENVNETTVDGATVNVTTGYVVEYRNGNKLLSQQFVANVEDAEEPANKPEKDGYEFVEWVEDKGTDAGTVTFYAKWKPAKGDVKDLGDTSIYGVTRADGSAIAKDSDVIGQKVILASGNLGDGAYYPNETDDKNDRTDENNTADQAYLAYDGNYGFNDYFVADFTGKNMPTLAFFANNYNGNNNNHSIFYGDGTKNGVVVATGLTLPNGFLFQEDNAFCTSVFNGKGLCMWGPHMIYSTAKNNGASGVLLHSNEENVALGRANLESGKKYRIIMGMQPGDDPINRAIKLVYRLYDLESGEVVEDKAINSYNFFADNWANAGQTRDQFCQGSIVAYGYFGTSTVLDKTYDIYEDTTINEIAADFGMPAVNNVTTSGDTITLGAGNIGDGASYTKGQNAGGSITQSYYAINGEYSFDDYIVFDFTGKNMPEIMFFAKNYDTSMYYTAGKQGVVVASGITLWDGSTGSAQSNNTKVGVSGPFGAYFEGAAAPYGGNMMSDFEAGLARANLEDGKQYRIVMGIENNGTTFTLKYMLYNLTDNVVVEEKTQTSWAFFTGSNAAVDNMTLDGLSGSIVLYGKFGENCTCTIDKLWGVYEDTTLAEAFLATMPDDDESGSGSGSEPTPDADPLAWMNSVYGSYTDQFDFYAYSAYSDGTYEIDGQKYYIGKNLANLKQYSQYGEVGMTIYFPQNDMLINGSEESIANAKKLIDDLAKVGIHKTILEDSRILYLSMRETAIVGSGCQFANEAALDAYVYDCLKDYATYPGVYGVMLGDEPKYSMISAYAAVYNSIKRVNAANGWNLFIQYNLNPLNVTQEVYDNYYPASAGTYEWTNYRYTLKIRDRFTDCVTRYKQYINDFLNAMNPDSIMYDDYPLMENKSGGLEIKDSYIPCLQIVAKAAADRGIKFYHVTQAYENNADGTIHRRAVTEKGAKWLNNILLGFGTKQIAYYTYYTRSESDSTGGESYVDGQSFVDYNGNPTALYYTMKDILSDNQIFAKVILQFNYKGSRVYGSTSANHLGEITVSNGFTKLTACSVNTGSALVTELYDEGNNNYMYMAMNVLDPDVAQTSENVTMTFRGYTKALVYSNGEFIDVELSSNVYTATVTPGEAVFVIPHN